MKALVLFSGGLDSRIAIKLLQEKGIEVEAVFFKLPFGGGCCSDVMCSFKFSQTNGFKLHIIDCTKGKELEEYLEMVKHPGHSRGAGINPCIDCKIFMFKKAEKLRQEISADFLATGEVLGQRPMSQTKNAFAIIDAEVPGIRRPLMEEGIRGRKREKQMKLAEKFNITNYPSPAGGCLLCEKALCKRFKFLLEKNLITESSLPLAKIGRHFWINEWFVVSRDAEESEIIEKYPNTIESDKGKPAVYYQKDKKTAKELQEAYSTGSKLRKEFEKYKI